MRFRGNLYSEQDDADINMTPMLDIVFILLIFFIVSTSFVREAGVDIQRPAAQSGEAQETVAVLVAITQKGEVWVDNRVVDLRMLGATLERLKGEQPALSAVVQADERSTTGLLIKVVDQLRIAGVEYTVATQSESAR
ncbi:MAG: ExbD/TolR family protein [Pontibacterium sp.]